MLLFLAGTRSFELVAYEEEEGKKKAQILRTSSLKAPALVPFAVDEIIEAAQSRERWQNNNGTLEFVHVHKCGGSTFNKVVPVLLCGKNDDVILSRGRLDPGCCLVRPSPSLVEALEKWTFARPPRYVSAKEEFSAYVLPWSPRQTFKAIMVRRPFERWVSEMLFACRVRGEDPLRVELALNGSQAEHGTRRNRLAQGLIPPAVLGDSLKSGDALKDKRLRAAIGSAHAFAFIGIVEAYDRSICLFARTFLEARSVCHFCCDGNDALPRVKAKPENNATCDANIYTDEDRHIYDAIHAADYQAYDIATHIFERRWDFAEKHKWGNADAHSCQCRFLEKRTPVTEHGPHHNNRSNATSS